MTVDERGNRGVVHVHPPRYDAVTRYDRRVMATTALGEERISSVEAVDSRTLTDCREQLQQAYVMGVASTIGCSVTNIDRDMHGIDVEVVRSFAEPREEVSVKAQLKSTTQISVDPNKK